ncbi:uncharacterized protein LTR77_000763 [Saxophila tyrrhenica]|uniref:Uncharacterized protein n=1 Tax=Saxophila tyrrhenica TaxID=1690608 RepID=A0AAV9PNJ5_9PEZI|nr:hypothetical protein LTR77_000763 [Saxophila tyrrhenica]
MENNLEFIFDNHHQAATMDYDYDFVFDHDDQTSYTQLREPGEEYYQRHPMHGAVEDIFDSIFLSSHSSSDIRNDTYRGSSGCYHHQVAPQPWQVDSQRPVQPVQLCPDASDFGNTSTGDSAYDWYDFDGSESVQYGSPDTAPYENGGSGCAKYWDDIFDHPQMVGCVNHSELFPANQHVNGPHGIPLHEARDLHDNAGAHARGQYDDGTQTALHWRGTGLHRDALFDFVDHQSCHAGEDSERRDEVSWLDNIENWDIDDFGDGVGLHGIQRRGSVGTDLEIIHRYGCSLIMGRRVCGSHCGPAHEDMGLEYLSLDFPEDDSDW